VKQDASSLKSAMVVEHLKEACRVVTALLQRTPVRVHHGGVKSGFEFSQGLAHLVVASS
jgi:hypothetical protein